MKARDFKLLIKDIHKEADKFELSRIAYKYSLEDLIFQTIAITKNKSKGYVIENLRGNIDYILENQAEKIKDMRVSLNNEFDDILNKMNQEKEI